MWGACVGVYQLLNWKMHGETMKINCFLFVKFPNDILYLSKKCRRYDVNGFLLVRFANVFYLFNATQKS